MAKLHNALATTELHNPKGIGVESSTEILLTMSASLGAVSASASIVPHTADTYDLGSDTQRWNNITAAGNISSSLTSTGSFGRLEIAKNATIDGTLTLAGGTTTIGDAASDTLVITADLASNLIPDADGTRDLGSSAASWRNIHLDGTGSFKNTITTNRAYFNDAGGEYISGDRTDLNLVSSADINIPADIGLTFGDDGEKIEGDGTDLTIAGNNINLTAVADVNIPSGVGLTFATAEKIESDGTDLSITVGGSGDINIPANIGLTFGDDGEKIEGDGTDLTIAGNNINLTAVADVVVPADVGITFGTGEKIEGNNTDLTVTSGADINLTAVADVNIPSGVGVTFGDDGEKIEGDGTNMTISANKILLNSTVTSGSSTSTGSFGRIQASTIGGNSPLTIEADSLALDTDGNLSGSGTGSFGAAVIAGTALIKGSGQKLYFSDVGGEYISGDGTDLNLVSGADINIPANIGLTFGNDGEKIEGDGTDLTIASSNLLNLSATTDIVIPTNVGLHFTDSAEKIESDGTDLTINSGAKINLTAVSDVHIPNNVGIVFGGASEKIEGDGTDLTIAGADINLTAVGDVNIPSGVGVTYGNDGEKIEGDGTDLTIASSAKLNLTATSDVHIPQNVGLVFDANASEKIESDDTDLTINSGADINLTATADVNIPASIGLTFGADTEKIEADGSNNLSIISNGNTLIETVTFNNGDVTIPGNLTVTGDRLEAQVGSLQVADHTITVGSGSATSALMQNGGIDWGISGSIAFLRYRHAGTAISSSVFLEAPKLTVDTITLDAAEIDASGALDIDTGGDLTLSATGDVNIPADIGLTFGNDGEKIEGDGTDLTITGNIINLSPTADVVIPNDKGIQFGGASEKIEGDGTDLTITGAKINLSPTTDVHIPNDKGVVFGDAGEKIEGDGTNMTISANIILLNSNMTSGSSTSTGSFGRTSTSTLDLDSIQGNWTNAGNTIADLGSVTTCDINGGTINGITDLAVADGGTGASTLTQNGALIGNGTSAVTAVDLSTDGVILIGDGSGNPTTLDVGGNGGITILGTIATGVWNGTAIVGTYIANDTIDSAHYAADSIDAEHYAAGSVDADAIGNDVVNSQHYAAGSIDNEHLADNAVDSDELAAGSVDDGHLSDGVATGLAGTGTTATSGVLNVIGGNGITANANDIAVTAAQTTITSIYATDLIMGEDAQTAIDFGTANQISFKTNNAEDFRMVAGGTFHANADVVAYSSTVASDMSLKENITDTKYGLSDIMKLRGVDFDWKREDMGHDVGVLAQEVEAVIPELVKEVDGLNGREGFKAVDYNKLVPVLIESIKELKLEIDELKKN